MPKLFGCLRPGIHERYKDTHTYVKKPAIERQDLSMSLWSLSLYSYLPAQPAFWQEECQRAQESAVYSGGQFLSQTVSR